jgi:hypothetical protein
MAAVAGVFVAAIAAGVAFGVVIGGNDPATGSAPTTSPSPSTLGSAPESGPPSASPSPSPSPSASADATPQETAGASEVENATPAATPSPEGEYGGATGDLFDITGEWDRIAQMPGGSEFRTSDSVILPDSRLAVFRHNSGSGGLTDPQSVLVYDRDQDTWETMEFPGERPSIATDQYLALGVDERIYSFNWIIDPSGGRWVVEPFVLNQESVEWSGSSLAVGGDGRLYRRARDTGSKLTELIAYDSQTDTFERSSEIRGQFDLAYSRPDGDLVLFGWAGESAMVMYDPETDDWSDPVGVSDAIAPWRAEVGFDGMVYVPGYHYLVPQLWAIDLDDGEMRSVELPDGVTEWEPNLLATPDNHLFAFSPDGAWIFTPDE